MRRWTIPLLVLAALLTPAGAQAQLVLTEAERGAALKYAEADGTVSSLEAQHSSSALAAAEQISGESQPAGSALSSGLTPNAQAMASTPIDLVVFRGNFVASNAHTPRGERLPEGTVLELAMNRLTDEPVAFHLGDSPTTTFAGDVQRESLPATAHAAHVSKVAHVRHPHAHVASWASGRCNDTNTTHCYAVDTWEMKGGGEEVEGSEFVVLMRDGSTPGGVGFTDEEEWVTKVNVAHWAEAGLTSQAEPSGLWWFWAWQNHSGYTEYLGSPYTWVEPVGEFARFALIAAGNNVWCLKIGPNAETQYWCMNTEFTYSTELQDGSEMDTVTKPEVAGTAESNYEALNGTLHNWNKATPETVNYLGQTVSGICVWPISGLPPGDINDGTC